MKYFLFLICFPFLLVGYEYKLAICSIFKDCAPYLKEWIEFHRMVGVEHFYLYDNSSADCPRDVLQEYIDQNIVSYYEWPDRDEGEWKDKTFAWVHTTQIPVFMHACKMVKNQVEWLALLDSDEFIVPVKDENIPSFLDKHSDYPGVAIRWQVYGTSGIFEIPDDSLMIELLTLRCKRKHPINKHTKLIVRPGKLVGFRIPIHSGIYKNDEEEFVAPLKKIRINHYINRDVLFFYNHKIKGKEKMDNTTWDQKSIVNALQLGNDVEDRIMDKFIPELRRRLNLNDSTTDTEDNG